MRKTILVTPLVAVLAVGTAGMYASAQDITSAVLTGTVNGPDGKHLQGVRVYVTSPGLLTPRDARTNAEGSFRFSLLPPGRYTITYSLDGYVSRKSEMTLVAGIVANASASLRKMTVQGETIEIVAEVSNTIAVDKTDTSVQTAFTTDRLEEIGGGRGVAALQDLTPGINGSLMSTFSIRGSLSRGNKVLQDGQMVNDALLGTMQDAGGTIEDLIESIAIVQSPLNAKLGNTDGGIISITSKRGGNNFSGSIRYSGSRGGGSFWRAFPLNYSNNLGPVAQPSSVSDDNFSRSWQYSITGPIVPNYLTFAIGGNIEPNSYTSNTFSGVGFWSTDWNNRWPNAANSQYARMGTFFLDNDPSSPYYGDVVRKSYWGAITSRDVMAYGQTSFSSNTFNLYLQVTPNHQLSYYYIESQRFQNINGNWSMGDVSTEYGLDTRVRAWNVSYKAVLGASGVLDARYGRSQNFRDMPKAGKETVQVKTYASYWAIGSPASPDINGTGNIIDFTQYHANGIIDVNFNANNSTNRALQSFNTLGIDGQQSTSASGVNSVNLNYQHMLDYKGNHIIDVGFNMEDMDADAAPPGARYYASPVGQIATDLVASQIGNTQGRTPGPAGYYAGRYIVFDVGSSRISDIEPHVLTRPNWEGNTLTDGYIWDSANGQLNQSLYDAGLRTDNLPFIKELYGNENAEGKLYTTQSSFYVNDMWTINDHHNVMLGLRADSFKLRDDFRTVHSYMKMTPRFEYKYDMFGNQRHLFAFSCGQFHQMANSSLYWPFAEKKWGNSSNRLWTGDQVDRSKKQRGYYLVDLPDILNPRNYTIEYAVMLSGKETGEVDKGFKPPTSTEYSVWYRRTFNKGGYIKVSFNIRTWADLYDYFPGKVFQYTSPSNQKSNRLQTILKNSDEFTRTYNGLELQWDYPLTRKVTFGGNYTFSSYKHNQSGYGSSTQSPGGTTSLYELQNLEWFDAMFSQDYVVDGKIVWSGQGRDTWMPMQKVDNEFSLGYYLIVNLSQGRARSNFTLRGRYTGSSLANDLLRVEVGYPVYPGINTYPSALGTGNSSQMVNFKDIPYNPYTTVDTFYNNFTYNLNMPLAKRLSWFLNININNVFNHINRTGANFWTARRTDVGATRYWQIQSGVNAQGQPTYTAPNIPYDPFANGWNWSGNMGNNFLVRNTNRRSISMSTGLRF
jgi:hypothetical protein